MPSFSNQGVAPFRSVSAPRMSKIFMRRGHRSLGVKRFSPGDGRQICPRSVLLSSVPGWTKSGSSEDEAMTRIRGKGVAAALILSGAGLAFLLAQSGAGQERLQDGNPRTAVLKPASSPYI